MQIPKILLASQSPRRRDLLQLAGFNFRVKAADVDESYEETIPPEKFPEHLAIKKARAVTSFAQQDEIILAADTIVLKSGIIFGKPENRDDANRILSELSGARHEVISGVCLLSGDKMKTFSATTSVWFHPLSEEQISFYIDQFNPYDKAGAYAIQEWIGLIGISKIEGCYFNVMGLPVSRVWQELRGF